MSGNGDYKADMYIPRVRTTDGRARCDVYMYAVPLPGWLLFGTVAVVGLDNLRVRFNGPPT